MIRPEELTRFHRTDHELEEFLLFCIMVANKPAYVTADKLKSFLSWLGTCQCCSPFTFVRTLIDLRLLRNALRDVRTGQYKRIHAAFRGVVKIDPRYCTLEELLDVPGIGPKTARLFLLHSRPDQQLASLDTHVLKFLRQQRVRNVPRSTPPEGPTYRRLERAFLRICARLNRKPHDVDLSEWRTRSIPRREAPVKM